MADVTKDDISELAEAIQALATQVDQGFKSVDQRFEQVDARFEGIDRRFSDVDRRFDIVDQRFDRLEQRVEDVRDELKGDIRTLQTSVDSFAKEAVDWRTEKAASDSQLNRHDGWIHQLADEAKVQLRD